MAANRLLSAPRPRRLRRAAGFTLVELLVVVAIMGIIAAIAAPSMANMIRVQRVRTLSFDIFAALNFARSEAIKRDTRITIRSVNGNDWSGGWQVLDLNNPAVPLQTQDAHTSCPGCATALTGTVVYESSGRIVSAAPAFTVSASDVPPERHRCIRVELSGRPVSTQGACP